MECPERDRLIRAHDDASRHYAESRGHVRDGKFGDGSGDHRHLPRKMHEAEAGLLAAETELEGHLNTHGCGPVGPR